MKPTRDVFYDLDSQNSLGAANVTGSTVTEKTVYDRPLEEEDRGFQPESWGCASCKDEDRTNLRKNILGNTSDATGQHSGVQWVIIKGNTKNVNFIRGFALRNVLLFYFILAEHV